jgi:hypothetical protein
LRARPVPYSDQNRSELPFYNKTVWTVADLWQNYRALSYLIGFSSASEASNSSVSD